MANICPCTVGNSVSQALFNLKGAKKLNCDAPTQTASASVLSRKVERTNEITMFQESPWLYLVKFRLESGEQIELKTSEELYGAMKEGTNGDLTWQDETLVSFQAK